MRVLPPGNILQNLYLKKRIKALKYKRFLEVGSGNGFLSNILLKRGLEGVGCDLNLSACQNNEEFNSQYIKNQTYKVLNCDFLALNENDTFDIIISAFVIEHLDDNDLSDFIKKMKNLLAQDGIIILFVPSSMKYWGVEDEIAGHFKRYEFHDFENFHELKIHHLTGLTYPISNLLFSLSNFLVKKNEVLKINLSQRDRTIYTGNRQVKFKTSFPPIFVLFLNEIVLYPFHILQMLFGKNKNSMVIYCELKK